MRLVFVSQAMKWLFLPLSSIMEYLMRKSEDEKLGIKLRNLKKWWQNHSKYEKIRMVML
jgi:hypothetical protein